MHARTVARRPERERCSADALPKVRNGNSFDAAARLLTVMHHVVVGDRDPVVRGRSTVLWRPAREDPERIGMKDVNPWLRRFLAMSKAAPMVRPHRPPPVPLLY